MRSDSPAETVLVWLLSGLAVAVGLVWGAGLVVGSILGATLPGGLDDGVAAVVAVFPDVGGAWQPPIPTWVVWTAAGLAAAGLGPLVWRLGRAGRGRGVGARWATVADLRRAGLLIADRVPAGAVAEEPEDG